MTHTYPVTSAALYPNSPGQSGITVVVFQERCLLVPQLFVYLYGDLAVVCVDSFVSVDKSAHFLE